MKLLPNIIKYRSMVLILGGASYYSSDDNARTPPVVETNTIADFVAAIDNYSSLEVALQITGLTSTSEGTENYTALEQEMIALKYSFRKNCCEYTS